MKYEIGYKTSELSCKPTSDGVDIQRTFTKEYAGRTQDKHKNLKSGGSIKETPKGTIHEFKKTTDKIEGWIQSQKASSSAPAAPTIAPDKTSITPQSKVDRACEKIRGWGKKYPNIPLRQDGIFRTETQITYGKSVTKQHARIVLTKDGEFLELDSIRPLNPGDLRNYDFSFIIQTRTDQWNPLEGDDSPIKWTSKDSEFAAPSSEELESTINYLNKLARGAYLLAQQLDPANKTIYKDSNYPEEQGLTWKIIFQDPDKYPNETLLRLAEEFDSKKIDHLKTQIESKETELRGLDRSSKTASVLDAISPRDRQLVDQISHLQNEKVRVEKRLEGKEEPVIVDSKRSYKEELERRREAVRLNREFLHLCKQDTVATTDEEKRKIDKEIKILQKQINELGGFLY
jgi:hypothetical protein